jgi:hypothetical protein
VDCRLVILVKLAKKVIPAVPNVPVVTRVKRVRVPVARANNVPLVNLVNPMITTLLLARRATPANPKKNKDKPRVTSVFWDNINPIMEVKSVWPAQLVNTKTTQVNLIALLLTPATLWSVVGPQLSMYRLVRSKQIAVMPTKVLAKRSNSAQRDGWATVHRTCCAPLASKDKPVPVEVLQVVAEHVPKASLVKQQDKKNAMNALLGFFNRKTKLPVHLARNVHRDGINRSITRPVVLI